MPNLVEKVKTFFIGTTPELREKVDKYLGLGLYYAEFGALVLFANEVITDCRFNPYLAPFTADAVVRVGNNVVKNYSRIKYKFDKSKFELPGIIGVIRELRQ